MFVEFGKIDRKEIGRCKLIKKCEQKKIILARIYFSLFIIEDTINKNTMLRLAICCGLLKSLQNQKSTSGCDVS